MEWFDVVLKLSALVGGALAILTFWRSAKVRRAEWLSNLHTRFFEGPAYKQIRRALDSNDSDAELAALRSAIATDDNSPLAEAFVDYLNFFEFVASLRTLRQLKAKEISMLFDYYLRLLCRHRFVREYIRKQGFEELDSLIIACVERKK